MNKTRIMMVLLALALLCGCVQEKATTTTTTTEPTTTTTTTSTTEATTTTTTRTTTTTTTLSVPEADRICAEYCQNNSYLSGTCRKARFECELRLEEKAETRTTLCLDRRVNDCCCKTNQSIEKNISYGYGME